MHNEMLKALAKKKRAMSEPEKNAKLSVLKDLMSQADGSMFDKIKGLKKVTVASNSPEGLEEGLDKAKEMVPNAEQRDADMADLLEGENEGFDFEDEHPDLSAAEPQSKGSDLADMVAKKAANPGSSMDEESPEGIDAKIMELMKKKEMLSKYRG